MYIALKDDILIKTMLCEAGQKEGEDEQDMDTDLPTPAHPRTGYNKGFVTLYARKTSSDHILSLGHTFFVPVCVTLLCLLVSPVMVHLVCVESLDFPIILFIHCLVHLS